MEQWFGLIALVISAVVVVFLFVTRKTPFTAAHVTTAVNSVQPLAAEVEKAATIVVQAIEQARRKGQLDKLPEYGELLNRVRGWLPVNVEPTNDQILDAINSAILVASALTNQINANKATVQEVADAKSPPQAWNGSAR